jgi:hypothetical protein
MAYEAVFFAMAGVALVSLCYPWHPDWPAAKWSVHLPLLLLPLWLLYEALMPGHMNIRLDIPLLILGVGFTLGVYACKLVLFGGVRARNHPPRRGAAN